MVGPAVVADASTCWVLLPMQLLAAHVMNPAHIEVEVADVLGLDTIIEELEYKVRDRWGRLYLESSARRAALVPAAQLRSSQRESWRLPRSSDVMIKDRHCMPCVAHHLKCVPRPATQVLYPLQRPEVYSTTLWKQTMGVLFYGPPGTGAAAVKRGGGRADGGSVVQLL